MYMQKHIHWSSSFLYTPLTFAFEEVERTEETSVSTCRGLGSLLAKELGKLRPRKIDQSSDVAEHQLQENIWALVAEFLHKKVRIEDDRWSAGTRASRGFLTIDHHAAHCSSGDRYMIKDWLLGTHESSCCFHITYWHNSPSFSHILDYMHGIC